VQKPLDVRVGTPVSLDGEMGDFVALLRLCNQYLPTEVPDPEQSVEASRAINRLALKRRESGLECEVWRVGWLNLRPSLKWSRRFDSDSLFIHRAANFDVDVFDTVREAVGLTKVLRQGRIDPDGWQLTIALLSLNACYAGIHASAWNYSFPSIFECWMWRAACIYIATFGWVLGFGLGASVLLRGAKAVLMTYFAKTVIATCLAKISEWTEPTLGSARPLSMRRPVYKGGYVWHFVRDYGPGFVSKVAAVILAVAPYFCYIVARVYIVVEAFISLRSVPIGVYASVPWANAIPHF
jgi:hypothetical protein